MLKRDMETVIFDLRRENDRLKRELETEKNLRMLDRAEVVQLRRMAEALIEEKEAGKNG